MNLISPCDWGSFFVDCLSCFPFLSSSGVRHSKISSKCSWTAFGSQASLGDPIYTACKNCGTKVDLTTGHCKRHESHNCQTIREEEVSILATVTLADHTGEVDRVLVDGERLQLLANAKSKEDLVALLMKRGPQAVCFCHPVDVRLATNGRKPGGGRSNLPAAAQGALQSQEADSAMENLPERQFQVLACQAALCQGYSEAKRPMIKKVVRVENQRATGMVFPIACPHQDLLFSGSSVSSCEPRQFFPAMSLCWCGQKMTKPRSLRRARGMTRSSCCSMRRWWQWRRSFPSISGWRPFANCSRQFASTCVMAMCILWSARWRRKTMAPTWFWLQKESSNCNRRNRWKGSWPSVPASQLCRWFRRKKDMPSTWLRKRPWKWRVPSGSFFLSCKIIADGDATGTVRASRSVILCALHFFFDFN